MDPAEQSNPQETRYANFNEFWPYYLSQHQSRGTRRLHVFGTLLALGMIAFAVWERHFALIGLAVVAGYVPAWIGHLLIEKNRPATFRYPVYSFMGDMKMIWQALTRRRI